jgi:hypothetical protein
MYKKRRNKKNFYFYQSGNQLPFMCIYFEEALPSRLPLPLKILTSLRENILAFSMVVDVVYGSTKI